MEKAINDFGNNLRRKKGVSLFYYAGHGVQVQGENYLLPINIIPQTAANVRYDAVPVGKLLGQMEEADNSMNLVILDACRNNPFPQSFRSANQGLAQVNAPTGSFISYGQEEIVLPKVKQNTIYFNSYISVESNNLNTNFLNSMLYLSLIHI